MLLFGEEEMIVLSQEISQINGDLEDDDDGFSRSEGCCHLTARIIEET